MKFKTYVGILDKPGRISYVTKVVNATKTASWSAGQRAKAMSQSTARDLVWALRCNGYPAAVITLPDFEEPRNPWEEDWFGETRWCDEDLAGELEEHGYIPTKASIALLRKECETQLHESAVETGWSVINYHISCIADKLVKHTSIYCDADEVAEEIGSVFGVYRVSGGEHIIEYDGVTYRYPSSEELILDWENTIRAQHEDSNGADGANWAQELLFIEELKMRRA